MKDSRRAEAPPQLRIQAVQCKLRGTFPERRLTEQEIRDEVTAARAFSQPLETLVIATTAPPDTALQNLAMVLTQDHGEIGPRAPMHTPHARSRAQVQSDLPGELLPENYCLRNYCLRNYCLRNYCLRQSKLHLTRSLW